jgi:hypothetical protein
MLAFLEENGYALDHDDDVRFAEWIIDVIARNKSEDWFVELVGPIIRPA